MTFTGADGLFLRLDHSKDQAIGGCDQGGVNNRELSSVDHSMPLQAESWISMEEFSEVLDHEAIYPSIVSKAQYDTIMHSAWTKVGARFSRNGIAIPSLDDFRMAHSELFRDLSSEAGMLRGNDDMVWLFGAPADADPAGEFRLLNRQLKEVIPLIRSAQQIIAVLSFTFARIVLSQPGVFGNKRVAMLLTLAQARALFRGSRPLHPYDHEAVRSALYGVGKRDELEPLSEIMAEIFGVTGRIPRVAFVAKAGLYCDEVWNDDPSLVVETSRIKVPLRLNGWHAV